MLLTAGDAALRFCSQLLAIGIGQCHGVAAHSLTAKVGHLHAVSDILATSDTAWCGKCGNFKVGSGGVGDSHIVDIHILSAIGSANERNAKVFSTLHTSERHGVALPAGGAIVAHPLRTFHLLKAVGTVFHFNLDAFGGVDAVDV